jgi:hypothetical protein
MEQEDPMGSNAEPQVCLGVLVRFSQARPERWELALHPGENPANLGKDEYYGFDVESGRACIMDLNALSGLGWLLNTEDNLDNGLDEYLEMDIWREVEIDKENNSQENVIIFSSGLGDGYYPCFVGYDHSMQVCTLLIDFLVIDDQKNDT